MATMVGQGVSMFERLGGISRALSHRNCAIYLAGMFVSLNGSFVFTIALGWLTWELTHAPAWVGAMVFAETVPNAVITPFAGAFVDRGRPLQVQKLFQLLQGISMSLLALATFLDVAGIWVLLGFALVQGILNGFAIPAHFAVVPKLVPRHELSSVIAMQSACAQSSRFVGPALAGVFLVSLGAGAAFAFNAVTFFVYVAAMLAIRIDDRPAPSPHPTSLLGDMAEGFAFIRGNVAIRSLLLLAVCAALLVRPVIDIMPAFVGDVLQGGPRELAWLLSAVGGSALLTTLWLARRGRTAGLARLMLGGFAVSAVAVMAFAAYPSFELGVVLIGIYGLSASLMNLSNMTLIQHGLEDRMRARVMGLFSLTHRAVPAVGALIFGNLAQFVGLPAPIVAGAALSLVFWLWIRTVARGGDYEAAPSASA